MEKYDAASAACNMNDYYELAFRLEPADADAADLLAASLADAGFESFVHDETHPGATLTAYVPAPLFDAAAVDAAVADNPMPCRISYTSTFVKGRDWNSEWERNYFKPIVIGGRVAVHSSFHTDVPEAEHDIVIDPRMAFGTGHHATTTLMMQFLLDSDLHDKNVVDMGTGTAILAILAAKLGARHVLAVEIDPAAADNAVDNVALNLDADCGKVTVVRGDVSALVGHEGEAQILLANINRNIITADIARYADALCPGGTLTVSGFYVADRPVVAEAAASAGLELQGVAEMDNWSSMTFKKIF